MSDKLIISAAVCGSSPTKEQNLNVPYTPEEIANQALDAWRATHRLKTNAVQNDGPLANDYRAWVRETLGARRVALSDRQPLALDAARRNARRNASALARASTRANALSATEMTCASKRSSRSAKGVLKSARSPASALAR